MHHCIYSRKVTNDGINRLGCGEWLGRVEGISQWTEDIADWWYEIVGKE